MNALTDVTWLGPWGLALFIVSVACLLIAAGVLAVTRQAGPALIWLAGGWVFLGLAVVCGAIGINGVVQFIKTKQTSPQLTPLNMLLRIWAATATAVIMASLLSLPVLIGGMVRVSTRLHRRIYALAVLTATAFLCANIIALTLVHEVGKYPYRAEHGGGHVR